MVSTSRVRISELNRMHNAFLVHERLYLCLSCISRFPISIGFSLYLALFT